MVILPKLHMLIDSMHKLYPSLWTATCIYVCYVTAKINGKRPLIRDNIPTLIEHHKKWI